MSGSRKFERLAWALTALMLALALLVMYAAGTGVLSVARSMGYEDRLFDNSRVHTLDIVMDDWEDFIQNATSEEYYAASVVIDGEAYKNIGLRAKGNTSLSTVAALGSERYSFKLEFDHYDKGKTYHGLDKLCLNNLIQDATMMKDYLTYTMMDAFGVNAPLCSYVYITVNGADWGLYLAVEGVEESFLQRNYGADYGELYKPDSMSMGGGRGNGKAFDMDAFQFDADGAAAPDSPAAAPDSPAAAPDDAQHQAAPDKSDGSGDNPTDMLRGASVSVDEQTVREAFRAQGLDESLLDGVDFTSLTMQTLLSLAEKLGMDKSIALAQALLPELAGNLPDMGGFDGVPDMGGGMGASDVKLQYIDDEPESYQNIWDSAKTDVTQADQTRLIAALRTLSGADAEDAVDAEQVMRYFVVHNFVCNGDSYTGSMVHNYYLYEKDGVLSMIPWDYNLAFGTFQATDADSAVNAPIDAPISGGTDEDRPMWSWILSSERNTEAYHALFAEFLSEVDIGRLIDSAYTLIAPYISRDPTAFYTADEFELGVQTLRRFCQLRTESIEKQLEAGGTTQQQRYADASGLTLSDMGSMGGGMGGFGGGQPQDGEFDADFRPDAREEGGNPPEEDQQPSGSWRPELPTGAQDDAPDDALTREAAPNLPEDVPDENGEMASRPEQPQPQSAAPDANGGAARMAGSETLLLLLVSLAVLAAGLITAKLYRA